MKVKNNEKIIELDNGTNLKYNISSERYKFTVDPLIADEWPDKIEPAMNDKGVSVENQIKMNLLYQLQTQGMLQMDLTELVKKGTMNEVIAVCDLFIKQMQKWGYKVTEIISKKNRILRVWDFGKQLNI